MRWLYIQDDTDGIIVTGITGICTNQFNLGQSSEALWKEKNLHIRKKFQKPLKPVWQLTKNKKDLKFRFFV